MAALTQSRLKAVLTKALKLKEPRFILERHGTRINGSVISETFRGKGDRQRQEMIWEALAEMLGPDSEKKVGMILAYTPSEWGIDSETTTMRRHAGVH